MDPMLHEGELQFGFMTYPCAHGVGHAHLREHREFFHGRNV